MSLEHFGNGSMFGTKPETTGRVDTDASVDFASFGQKCGGHITGCAMFTWSEHAGNFRGRFDKFFCCHGDLRRSFSPPLFGFPKSNKV